MWNLRVWQIGIRAIGYRELGFILDYNHTRCISYTYTLTYWILILAHTCITVMSSSSTPSHAHGKEHVVPNTPPSSPTHSSPTSSPETKRYWLEPTRDATIRGEPSHVRVLSNPHDRASCLDFVNRMIRDENVPPTPALITKPRMRVLPTLPSLPYPMPRHSLPWQDPLIVSRAECTVLWVT
jgi:hypothetical protein